VVDIEGVKVVYTLPPGEGFCVSLISQFGIFIYMMDKGSKSATFTPAPPLKKILDPSLEAINNIRSYIIVEN
jgi:hypothetical protein